MLDNRGRQLPESFVAFDDPEMLEHLKIPKGSVRKSFPLIVLRVLLWNWKRFG